VLTFNPCWDKNAENLEAFTDVRMLQGNLKEQFLEFDSEANEKTEGPASFTIVDPDGSPILFDQNL